MVPVIKAAVADGVVRVTGCVPDFVCLSVRALKAKWLEQSIPKSVDIAYGRHALIVRWKGQGYKVIKCTAGRQ